LNQLMRGDCGSYGGPVNWDIHSRALGHLLRSRGFQQFQTPTGCQLFQIAYHFIVRLLSWFLLQGSANLPKANSILEIHHGPSPRIQGMVEYDSVTNGYEAIVFCPIIFLWR
jgi:hypothetical protein